MVLFPFKSHLGVQQRSKSSFVIQQPPPPVSPRSPALRVSFRAASSVWEEALTPTSREGSTFYPSQAELGIGMEAQLVDEHNGEDQWITIHPMMSNNPVWLAANEGPRQGIRWRIFGVIATGIATLCLTLAGLVKK